MVCISQSLFGSRSVSNRTPSARPLFAVFFEASQYPDGRQRHFHNTDGDDAKGRVLQFVHHQDPEGNGVTAIYD